MTPQTLTRNSLRFLTWAVLAAGSLVMACGSPNPGGGHGGAGGTDTGGDGGYSGSGGTGGSTTGGHGGGGTSGTSGTGGKGGSTGGMGGGGSGGSAGEGGSSGAGGSGNHPDAGADGGGGSGGMMASGTGLLKDPLMAFPKSIKDTGVFDAPPDFTKHSARLKEYSPSPELWSDGLHKDRWILLPQGTKVDTTDSKKYAFPPGTIFVKMFQEDTATAGKYHPVETRFIRMTKDMTSGTIAWEFAVYQWNADGTDATLADNADATRIPVDVTIAGKKFSHDIPSNNDCKDCHMSNRMSGVESPPKAAFIGFDEIRLNSKLGNATDTQFADLFKSGIISQMPTAPATIADPNPVLLKVKRFVYGNCVHCHHGDGAFDMRPDVFVMNTVNQMTDASGVTPPKGYLRIVPKQPEKSVIYLQVRRTMLPDTLKPMPPIGVAAPPPDELMNIQTWINSLTP